MMWATIIRNGKAFHRDRVLLNLFLPLETACPQPLTESMSAIAWFRQLPRSAALRAFLPRQSSYSTRQISAQKLVLHWICFPSLPVPRVAPGVHLTPQEGPTLWGLPTRRIARFHHNPHQRSCDGDHMKGSWVLSAMACLRKRS